MQRLLTGITIFLLGILNFYSTDGIRCYVCNTVTNRGCGSKLDLTKLNATNTAYIVEINSTQQCSVCNISSYPISIKKRFFSCQKRKISNIYLRGYSVVTACPNGGNHCNSSKIADLTIANCCCNTDLCNGVSLIQLQYYLLIPTICVFIIIKKIFTV
ncbi:unnamed protein product [Adineta steineri]|uniref:Protein sleepless n=1 Tax=Adineta steineri TaxID=433720 RepID=A0A814WDX3_9BILA|nr:unnamed protein product [Adineta steineri]CAF1470501.1 unnamed protein product [Adineta steineri]